MAASRLLRPLLGVSRWNNNSGGNRGSSPGGPGGPGIPTGPWSPLGPVDYQKGGINMVFVPGRNGT